MRIPRFRQAGFTLIEMIMVIVITGIVGGMVAMFLKAPIQQYMDVTRRAELTDIADTALYRLASDISTAVPNSVRIAGCGATPCVEFIPTKDGGRYRAVQDLTGAAGVGDILDPALADSSFDIIGPMINFAATDLISVAQSGVAPYAAFAVPQAITGGAGPKANVIFAAPHPPFVPVPSHRFDVVDGAQQAVTYACVGTLGALDANNNGQARLVRYSGYGFNAAQALPATPNPPLLADKVSNCSIGYDAAMGLLEVQLTLTSGGESVSLYHEIHVLNAL